MKKQETRSWFDGVHSLLCLLLMFGFGQLPAFAPLTAFGMKVLGIFLGLLYGWIFVGNIWPSLAGLLALLLVGGMKPAELWHQSFGDPVVVMMLFIFTFCAAINAYGVAKYLSLWMISRKILVGRPWLFTFVFLLSIAGLSGLTSSSPAILIGWNILYGICEVCGYQREDAYPRLMLFGVVFAAQFGMAMVPFKQLPLTVLSVFEGLSGSHIPMVPYMLLAVVCCASGITILVLMMRFVMRPDVSALCNLRPEALGTDGRNMTRQQKIMLGFLVLLVMLLILPSILPSSNLLAILLCKLGNTGICMVVVTILCAIKVDGVPLLRFGAMVQEGVAWGIILLLAVVQPLSAAMNAPESGITAALLVLLQPLFDGHSSAVFLLTIGLVALLLANVINVGAVGVSLMPVLCTYCASAGIVPQPAAMLVVLSIHLGLLAPSASTSAALLHGNASVQSSQLWKMALPVISLSWMVMAGILLGLGGLLTE